MKKIGYFLSSLILILNASDQIPAPKQSHSILIKGGVIYPVSSDPIYGGEMLFVDGIITCIGKKCANELPDNTETIDLTGKHIYPGFIAANTTLGLTEINAVRATRDYAETGTINPNVRAEVSYNPDSELIPVARSNGITLVNTVPRGGLISGTSAVMMLDGWTWENATLKAPTGLHIKWPSFSSLSNRWWENEDEERDEAWEKTIRKIEDTFQMARQYVQAKESEADNPRLPQHKPDLRWESMIPVLKKEIPVFVHANRIRQIETAINWAHRENVNIVIMGGKDSWLVTDLLKKYNVPVILESIHSLPSRRWENYDTPFTTPWKLSKAGVKFCISASSSPFQAPHQRNLPYHAATAAAYGLSKNEALKTITLYAAEILGVNDKVGSLELHKDATFIVTDGDPLEVMTQVEMVFIQGKKIDLSDRHKILYSKYQEKYRQLGIIK